VCIVERVFLSLPEPAWDAVKDILGYFVRNPQAVDSPEGVARWRVMQQQVHRSLEQTEAALAWLVSEEYLQEAEIAGAGRVVRLNPNRQENAAQFLQTMFSAGKAER
jgi:hypothetical protein